LKVVLLSVTLGVLLFVPSAFAQKENANTPASKQREQITGACDFLQEEVSLARSATPSVISKDASVPEWTRCQFPDVRKFKREEWVCF
jgi:hypothetical protein